MVEQFTKEPYTCERLTQIRGGYRPLTKSFVALHFDFCNPEVQTADDYDSATLCSVIGGSRSLLMYSPWLHSQSLPPSIPEWNSGEGLILMPGEVAWEWG